MSDWDLDEHDDSTDPWGEDDIVCCVGSLLVLALMALFMVTL